MKKLTIEDRLNEEVRDILGHTATTCGARGSATRRWFRRTKNQLIASASESAVGARHGRPDADRGTEDAARYVATRLWRRLRKSRELG